MKQHSSKNLSDFCALPDQEIDLALGALLIAKDHYPDLEVSTYLSKIDEMGERARLRVGNVVGGRQIIEGMNHYFFVEEGFRGNGEDYYNPVNSFLNDVIDHRMGIPITLALLYIEIGKRAGLPLHGVSFPGHFLVKYLHEDLKRGTEEVIIDPFHKGNCLSREECASLLKQTFGGRVRFDESLFRSATKREILTRLLINLQAIYGKRNDRGKELRIMNQILLLNPEFYQTRDSSLLH